MRRASMTVLSMVVLCVFCATAIQAQHVTCVDEKTREVVPCPTGSSSSSSGGDYSGLVEYVFRSIGKLFSSGHPGTTSSGDAERQQSHDAAYERNEEGIRLADAGDWPKAVNYFRDALRNEPSDSVIRGNLELAEEQVRQLEARAQAAQRAQEGIANLTIMSKTPVSPSTSGLDFTGASGDSGSQGLSFMSGSAGDELKSAVHHGTLAEHAAHSELEFMSGESKKVFDDRRGDRSGSLAVDKGDAVDSRGAAVDPSSWPDFVRKNPQIVELSREERHWLKEQKRLETQLQVVREKKGEGDENAGQLSVEEARLKQQRGQAEYRANLARKKMVSRAIQLQAEASQPDQGKSQQ